MRGSLRAVVAVVAAIATIVPMLVLTAGVSGAATFTSLTLQNGWTDYPGSRVPGVSLDSGIVTFVGGMKGGTSATAFTLPTAFRPTTDVYVAVGECLGAKGRLEIRPSGVVTVEDQGGGFTTAQCGTSLDGASFALSTSGFTSLTLQNGWTNAPFGTSDAAAEDIEGVVHLKGAIATTGTNPVPFTLPPAFRPATNVFVPVDLCTATPGRLDVAPSGVVTVEAAGGTFADAQCFTSLDGASFALSASGFTSLTLQNGWTNAPFGTSDAAAEDIGGVVHLKGAIATSSTNTSDVPFTLPPAFRPSGLVLVPVDLCDAGWAALLIGPSGAVNIEPDSSNGPPAAARCFTSLDGVSFAAVPFFVLPTPWTSGPSGTSAAAVGGAAGIGYLKGAIATTGTNPVPFTLPPALRPATNVYVPVDLCHATNGRLQVEPSGVVTVQAQGGAFSNAQCLTSLEGASFALSASGSTPLSLENGWTNGPFGTSDAAVRKRGGIVHLEGAIATTGTNPVPFTLPPALRPATNVYVPVDLCNATNGRLFITPSGVVTVQAQGGAFSNAACFTSLDGATFAASRKGFVRLELRNGWKEAPFGTSNAAGEDVGGIVHLKGAVAGGRRGVITTLPVPLRPAENVFVPVDLCGADHGQLLLEPSGTVRVGAEKGAFARAQCLTSLDGVSYAA